LPPAQAIEDNLSQATFLNRQALYLRPDPARVIVRPFKPATEPRDLNPTDKTRANHIVDRVLALDSETVASQLADVLENFLGRHRNLLEKFEARAEEMEDAFAAHGIFSERVIFPVTESQLNGIEDARFVEFSDGARKTYYATYTAYSGRAIRSELIETRDFVSFRLAPLRGTAARNKGMALFPRKIGGKYAMIARQDNENLYLIYSDDLYTWGDGQAILKPEFPWEFVQIGNCGSPIELDEGWLLLTHGVGPVRKYSIGAALLDKNDPSKVLARSREPLLRPEPSEREGYVPNVVYTCGAIRHNDHIILPYAVSDTFSNFATIKISALMQAMRS
jgi:predicted GH43/DUF377 family glycosyl hydrolase